MAPLNSKFHAPRRRRTSTGLGASKIDFSRHPEQLVQRPRTGAEIQLHWVSERYAENEAFLAQVPHSESGAVEISGRRRD